MLGLHDETLFRAGVTVAILIVFGCGLGVMWRQPGKVGTWFRWGLCIGLAMTAVIGGYFAFASESSLDARDAVIAQKLTSYGIVIEDSSGTSRITVRSGTCVATYGMPASSLITQGNLQPLNAGTGTAVKGCDPKVDLDDLFIKVHR